MKVLGVARDGENPQALNVVFGGAPSDDELRAVHERLKSFAGLQAQCGLVTALLVEQHNEAAGAIVTLLIGGVAKAGGSLRDTLVLTESVLVGVMLAIVRLGGDDLVLDELVGRVRQRLAEKRLGGIPVEGAA